MNEELAAAVRDAANAIAPFAVDMSRTRDGGVVGSTTEAQVYIGNALFAVADSIMYLASVTAQK